MSGSRRYQRQPNNQDREWINQRARRRCEGVDGAKESPDEGAYAVAAWPSSASAEGLQSQGEREKTIEEP